jgi:Arc/MetJ family transcription regulator
MKITIEIPEELLQEVMNRTGTTTKSQAIKMVLEEKIALVRRKRILNMKGSIDLDIDLVEMRNR